MTTLWEAYKQVKERSGKVKDSIAEQTRPKPKAEPAKPKRMNFDDLYARGVAARKKKTAEAANKRKIEKLDTERKRLQEELKKYKKETY